MILSIRVLWRGSSKRRYTPHHRAGDEEEETDEDNEETDEDNEDNVHAQPLDTSNICRSEFLLTLKEINAEINAEANAEMVAVLAKQ